MVLEILYRMILEDTLSIILIIQILQILKKTFWENIIIGINAKIWMRHLEVTHYSN